ncbi:MAG: hypothetical protein AAB225_25680 [Acidobacteriota bacterium]
MSSAPLIQADLLSRLGWRPRAAPETVATGVAPIDRLTGGLPRGAVTEIFGPASSGRTSLLVSILADAAARQETCAVVDACDAFDPASAAAAGVDLDRLLWVRCAGNPEHALKAADLLVNAGGFGLIVLDIAGVAPRIARRIPLASWFRLRRAIENTPTLLIVVGREPCAGSCVSLLLEMKKESVVWSGAPNARLLRGVALQAIPRKPVRPAPAAFAAESGWVACQR